MKRALASVLVAPLLLAQFPRHPVTLAEALPLLEQIPERPIGLNARPTGDEWQAWMKRQASQAQTRLIQGEADSIAYFLLYGVSFTCPARFAIRCQSRHQPMAGPRPRACSMERPKPMVHQLGG